MEHMGDDIQHCCHMVAANVDILRDALLGEAWGYLARLEKAAHAGGFVTHETTEAIKLAKAAMELRNLADRIALVRENLVINDGRGKDAAKDRRKENVQN
jgi:hypothetical protein